MKFTVEVGDFWLDEEELSEALQKHVKHDVVQQISQSIKKQVDQYLTTVLQNKVEAQLEKQVQGKVAEVLETGLINPRYEKGPITLKEYIEKMFSDNTGFRSPEDQIKKLSKAFGNEMRSRYDLLYASQIVATLGENGLLKDDVRKLLIEPKTK